VAPEAPITPSWDEVWAVTGCTSAAAQLRAQRRGRELVAADRAALTDGFRVLSRWCLNVDMPEAVFARHPSILVTVMMGGVEALWTTESDLRHLFGQASPGLRLRLPATDYLTKRLICRCPALVDADLGREAAAAWRAEVEAGLRAAAEAARRGGDRDADWLDHLLAAASATPQLLLMDPKVVIAKVRLLAPACWTGGVPRRAGGRLASRF
jgi:hypothetical protein